MAVLRQLWSVDTRQEMKQNCNDRGKFHYSDVMRTLAYQITSVSIVYSTVVQAQIKKHQSSASLASVRRIHRSAVNSQHKKPVTRKMFPFDDVIMLPVQMHVGKFSGYSDCKQLLLVRVWFVQYVEEHDRRMKQHRFTVYSWPTVAQR